MIRMYDLIEKKKHGEELTDKEIYELITAYTKGDVPDYQMSAFLMAVWFCGMSDREVFTLTDAMAHSGDTVDLSAFGDRSVDKHSTGGVGDKTTLIVAPTVAVCGGIVAKMSGRGLGHTGGTVDKLESFTGFATSLTPEAFTAQVKRCGLAVIGQSADLAPADKKLYALRDVTATVDSIPLIASSIMSKKLAAGTRSIVLDVKCGSGAFMQTPERARDLADMMVRIGNAHGRRTAAIISNMSVPLGHAVGNVLEVREAIEVLRGGGPDDLREVSVTLATLMVQRALQLSRDEAHGRVVRALSSGAAFEQFCVWIAEQGGDASFARNPDRFGTARYERVMTAPADCYLGECNTAGIGTAAMLLGAGRAKKTDVIDVRAGIVLHKKTGDRVTRGEPIATLYTEKEELLDAAENALLRAHSFTTCEVARPQLIFDIVE